MFKKGDEMEQGNLNQNEQGRSMVEMLGVLAVVGLLSVMAFAGFKIALNKAKANAIIHDGRMVWAEALAWQTVPTRNDWIDSQAANESGKSFAVWRDIKDNNYIKVEGVEEEVCEQMLPHQHEGSLLFLTTSFEDLTTCPEGENAIVMAFDGVSGKPAECENQKGCQDLYTDAFYCDGEGHCQECDPTISVVNASGDGCECNSAVALTCDDGNGHTWCCGQDEYGQERICGTTPGECTVSDLTCEYTINLPTAADLVKSTNCSYSISISGNVGTMTSVKDCTLPDEYCYLGYADSDCDPQVTASANNTTIYGNCIKRNQNSIQGLMCQVGVPPATSIATEVKGCPVNKYCYLKWQTQGCASSDEATAATTGTFYGACLLRNKNGPSCPYNN